MNLAAYDKIDNNINQSNSWIDVKRRKLVTKCLPKRRYYCISKRYDDEVNINRYFLITFDDKPTDRKVRITDVDTYGRQRFTLGDIWNQTILQYATSDVCVHLNTEVTADDGDIYEIELN
jgi:hypothetical protein